MLGRSVRVSAPTPRYDQRLNAVRYAKADPAQALAAACLVVALADARDPDEPARRAEAAGWLSDGQEGQRWALLLGAEDVLARIAA